MEAAEETPTPTETLYILGAGPVSEALARIASIAGFEVKVLDCDEGKLDAACFADAQLLLVDFENLAQAGLVVEADDYICVITRGHTYDNQALAWALGTPAHYIGMMGCAKHIAQVSDYALEQGRTSEQIERVHMPIGIDINAKDAAEIGLAIAAQLVQVREDKADRPKDKESLHRE